MFQLQHADPRTREGELLWPARLPEEEVVKLEEQLGEIGTAGQLQQRPVPRGGGICKREHFRFYRTNALHAILKENGTGGYAEVVTSHASHFAFEMQALSVDAAFKDTKASSYVVVQAWGKRQAFNYLLAQVRDRLTFTKTIAAIRAMRAAFPNANATLIEDKANGPAIIDVLSKEIPGIIAIEPTGSKEARAEAVAPLIHAGNVVLPVPDEAPWVEGFISEWLAVPTGAFWDQVDASDQYLLKYGRTYNVNVPAGSAVAATSTEVDVSGSPWGMNR